MIGNRFFRRVCTRFRYNSGLKMLLRLTGRPIKPKKWVFIIGCYNSGTTLLQELLSNHPDVAVLPDEGVVLSGELNRPEDFGWTRMWTMCYDKVKMDASAGAGLAESIKRHWSHFYPSKAMDYVFVEKSISNATRIPFFAEHFKPAYFIYIRRNGYAVAEGIRRKARPGDYPNQPINDKYPIEYCAQQWKHSAEVCESALNHVENRLNTTYEELCERPAECLSRITRFLEISDFDVDLTKLEYTVHGLSSNICNQNTRSLSRLSKQETDAITLIAEKYLREYGYVPT